MGSKQARANPNKYADVGLVPAHVKHIIEGVSLRPGERPRRPLSKFQMKVLERSGVRDEDGA